MLNNAGRTVFNVKPILFNADMVRAILEGRKTVTRRVVKDKDTINWWDCEADGTPIAFIEQSTGDCYPPTHPCPYQPGDILYVRETCRLVDFDFIDGDWSASVQYKADDGIGPRLHYLKYGSDERMGWRPSIHMPREAARIFLRVTDVRVERLQDITEDGAIKEGCTAHGGNLALDEFEEVWHNTIKSVDRTLYGWDANPWVWVIEFERISKEEAQP